MKESPSGDFRWSTDRPELDEDRATVRPPAEGDSSRDAGRRPAEECPSWSERSPARPATYAFVSLGCPKNLVDSEKMLGTLALDGYALVSDPDGADFVIVNTCGFIQSAREESRSVIREMAELKRRGRLGGIIVAGCLPERLGPELLDEIPEIDQVVGVFGRDEIHRVAERLVGRVKEQRELFRPAPIRALDDRSRLRITPQHFAYLKISEGCSRTCTFCAIPRMRGRHVTKPIEMVVEEARELASDGARELILVAQDTTFYGLDLYGEPRLADLLRELEQVEGIDWIRLLYLYPLHITDELIRTIAESSKILPYLDIPLQHINDTILKRMQRRITGDQTRRLIERLRAEIPHLVLRTTFLVGFPGETDEQFEELVRSVEDVAFERMGVFTFSREPGTPADRLPGQVPEAVKEARRDELMRRQQPHAFAFGDALVGLELDVLIDTPAERGVWQGRTYADAPDIDGAVFVSGEAIGP
ncbi:MAG TPA: 30S ribosomal protein S12 methylthiotransferase RimO, partial [Planctomycetaceae bacterium]|nr:30S ribosomal protein S12 methylthiotransferase RimO [Planctomycetaceae bacterium]